ncbi:MAG: hypothetical protein ABIP61_05460 [Burkholderiaceae bacterium]
MGRGYRAEITVTQASHASALRATLSRHTERSASCHREDESHCHRAMLRTLPAERDARFAQPWFPGRETRVLRVPAGKKSNAIDFRSDRLGAGIAARACVIALNSIKSKG